MYKNNIIIFRLCSGVNCPLPSPQDIIFKRREIDLPKIVCVKNFVTLLRKKRGKTNSYVSLYTVKITILLVLDPVVQKVDNTIHWIILLPGLPVDNPIGLANTYLLDSDFPVDSAIQRLNIRGPIITLCHWPGLQISQCPLLSFSLYNI